MPAGDQQTPVGDNDADKFSQSFGLLTDRMSRARGEQQGVGFPEFEKQLNLPTSASEDESMVKGQLGHIAEINGPHRQGQLTRRERLLLKSRFFFEPGCPFGNGLVAHGSVQE